MVKRSVKEYLASYATDCPKATLISDASVVVALAEAYDDKKISEEVIDEVFNRAQALSQEYFDETGDNDEDCG